jgi:adenine phosphoribosyltransferase
MDSRLAHISSLIRDVPDFPKPGIVFKDITPLLGDAAGFRAAIDLMAAAARPRRPEVIVAIESRGFLFGAALALTLGVGLVPVRKPGKLPHRVRRVEYALEYGTDKLEVHEDAPVRGARALIVDDVLATGGTAAASARLIRDLGAEVVGCAFCIELAFLGGRKRLEETPVDALLTF